MSTESRCCEYVCAEYGDRLPTVSTLRTSVDVSGG